MSDDRWRRRSPDPASRRVGVPNVLSDAAQPNTLEGLSAVAPTDSPIMQSGSRQGSATSPGTGTAARKRKVRLPSYGTLVFLAFLAVTAFRVLGQVAPDVAGESPAATRGSAEEPGALALEPGAIVFGTAPGRDCGVLGKGDAFVVETEVWWSALLTTEQTPEDEVVVVLKRERAVISREIVPADASGTKSTVLCNSEPVRLSDVGSYYVEVWNTFGTARFASGGFRMERP